MEPGPLLGQGREAEIFAWKPGTVLRLMRDPDADERVAQQAAAMRAASDAGAPVPAVHETVRVLDRPGLVMERAEGHDLLTILARQPWKMAWVARTMGEVQARLHEVRAPASLPDLHGFLRERIEVSARLVPSDLTRRALDLLAELSGGDRLCHGDFGPPNVLLSRRGPLVIDWVLAARGHPTADVGRTSFLFRLGTVPPGTPLLIRLGDRFGRPIMYRAYLRSYRRHRSVDAEVVARWEFVYAAARPAERIPGEVPRLVRFMESRASG